jgi:hypothetical protein
MSAGVRTLYNTVVGVVSRQRRGIKTVVGLNSTLEHVFDRSEPDRRVNLCLDMQSLGSEAVSTG